MSTTIIDDLPEEILLLIFSKLELSDRKRVRLVNKKWLQVCSTASATKNEFIKLNLKHLKQFKTPRGCFNLGVYVKEALSANVVEHDEFWALHGHSIKTVHLNILDHHYPIIYKIINYCLNIEELAIKLSHGFSSNLIYKEDNGLEGVKAQLDRLKILMLAAPVCMPLGFLTGAAFCRLTDSIPNLQRLVLDSVEKGGNLYAKPIMSLIAQQAFNLTELAIRDCSFATDSFIELVFETIGPQLTDLHLSNVPIKSVEFLTKNADNLPNLKNLVLDFPANGIGLFLSPHVLLNLRKLEFISLFRIDLCDKDVEALVGLENLKCFKISDVGCTAKGILKCFGVKMYPNLRVLKLNYFECLTDGILAAILPNLPNLQSLDLSYCEQVRASGVVGAINANCKKLTHLSLVGCTVAEPVVLNGLKGLIYLDLRSCLGLKPKRVVQLRLQSLKTLRLNLLMPEKHVQQVCANCPRLKEIVDGSKVYNLYKELA